MTSTKPTYTAGPWRIGDAGNTVFGPKAPVPEVVAAVMGAHRRANAALIHAAPELLEALEMALPYVESELASGAYDDGVDREVLWRIHSAIDKALGRKFN